MGKPVSEQSLQKNLYFCIIFTFLTFGFKYATVSSGNKSVDVYGAAELIFLVAALVALISCLLVYKKNYDYLIATAAVLFLINIYRLAAIYQMSSMNKIDSNSAGQMIVHNQNLFSSLLMSGVLVYLCFDIKRKFGGSGVRQLR